MFEAARRRLGREEGFTLIELLVVILIIGILAAIAIPSFLNQREKGQDACAKSQARTMATAIETYYTDNATYVGADLAKLTAIESAVQDQACGDTTGATVGGSANGTTGGCTGTPTADSYCVAQTSQTTASFSISKASGAANQNLCGPAARAGKGGCPTGGKW